MTPFQANCQTKQLVPHQMLLQVWWSPGALGPKPFRIPQASNSGLINPPNFHVLGSLLSVLRA